MGLLETIRGEWSVLKSAPWSVVAVMTASVAAGMGLCTFLYARQIETLTQTVELYKARADDRPLAKSTQAPQDTGAAQPYRAPAPVPVMPRTPSPVTLPPKISNSSGGAFSINQSGGITASTVNVATPPPRQLTAETKAYYLATIPKDKPILVRQLMGDAESFDYAHLVYGFLKENGYTVVPDIANIIMSRPIKGASLTPSDDGTMEVLTIGVNPGA